MIRQHCVIVLTFFALKCVSLENEFRLSCLRTYPAPASVTEDTDTCSKQSCKGHCGEKPSFVSVRHCSCHETCLLFGNCCKNFFSICKELKAKVKKVSTNRLRKSCQNDNCYRCIDDRYFMSPLYAVSRCPNDIKSETVEKCEFPGDRLIEHIPIMHNRSKDVFRNLYCALCHERDLKEFQALEPLIHCDRKSKAKFANTPVEQIYLSKLATEDCTAMGSYTSEWLSLDCCVIWDDFCPDIKECASVTQCHSTRRCRSFTEAVYATVAGKSNLILRNKHCAECISTSFPSSNISCVNNNLIRLPFQQFKSTSSIKLQFSPTRSRQKQEILPEITSSFRPNIKLFLATENVYDLYMNHVLYNLKTNFPSVEFSPSENDGTACNQSQNTLLITNRSPNDITMVDWIKTFPEIANAFLNAGIMVCGAFISNTFSEIEESCVSNMTVGTLGKMCRKETGAHSERSAICNFKSLPPFQTIIAPQDNLSMVPFPPFSENQLLSSKTVLCAPEIHHICELRTTNRSVFLQIFNIEDIAKIRLKTLLVTDNMVSFCHEEMPDTFFSPNGWNQKKALEFIGKVCASTISVFALVASIFTSCFSTVSKSMSSRCTLGFLLSFLFVEVLHLLAYVVTWQNALICTVLAILSQFCWLSTFSWNNAMVLDSWRSVVACKRNPGFSDLYSPTKFLIYSLSALVMPVLVTGICVCLDVTQVYTMGYEKDMTCSIGDRYAFLLAFILPWAISMLINIVTFIIIEIEIRSFGGFARVPKVFCECRDRLPVYIGITAIMSLTLIISFFANLLLHPVISYVFSIIVSFHGLFVCCALKIPSLVSMYKRRSNAPFPKNSEVPGC